MNRYCIRLCCIVTFYCVFLMAAFAQASSVNLEKICQRSPNKCLISVEQQLTSTPKGGRHYYSLLQLKFDALFTLQNTQELYKLTNYWRKQPDLPVPFQMAVYIYFAKTTIYYGNEEEGIEYIGKAKKQLALMQNAYPSPIRIVRLANLQLYVGEYQQAYNSLLQLSKKYENTNNPYFMMELNGNLAHLASRLNKAEEEEIYWLAALKWGHQYGNQQQIATIHLNLGIYYTKVRNYSSAAAQLLNAISFGVTSHDTVRINHARLLLTEVYLNDSKKQNAQQTFTQIILNDLPKHLHNKYNSLKAQVL